MPIGFIGLGRMGRGMALNLQRAGHELLVFDASVDAVQVLTEAGARAAGGIAEIAETCDVVFTSLPGPVQVEEVVLGPGGLVAHARPGLTLFDLSTSSHKLLLRIDVALRERAGGVLDAPVSGGPAGAASGDLVVWVGGDRDVYDQHEALLASFSKPHFVGALGSAIVTKLVHNLTGYLVYASLAETFSLGVKAGADPLQLWEAMKLGMVGRQSPLDGLVNQFLPGVYDPPAFSLKLALKDVRLATALGRELDVPLRLSSLTLEEMTEAYARGMGEEDSRSYMKLQLERAGVEIAVDPTELAEAVERARQ